MTRNKILHQFGLTDAGIASLELQAVRSLAFEPNLTSDNPVVIEFVDRLAVEAMRFWVAGKRRVRADMQQNVHGRLRVILLNLVYAAKRHKQLSIGIATGQEALNSSRRYRPGFMTVRAFTDAVTCLMESGIIEVTEEAFNYPGGGQVARYRLKEVALSGLGLCLIDKKESLLTTFSIAADVETIRLKDRGTNKRAARLCHYKDTAEVIRMRDNLKRINTILGQASITVSHQGVQAPAVLPAADPGRNLSEQGQTLYRVFNNGTFDEGG